MERPGYILGLNLQDCWKDVGDEGLKREVKTPPGFLA